MPANALHKNPEVSREPVSKVLIVEDNLSIAESLVQLLQANGWVAETANTGRDGLQLLSQFSYDLVLLDWGLPDVVGIDICKFLRKSGSTVPIIFITAQDDIDSTEAGLEAGGDDYIAKPFNERELMARVRSVMRRPRSVVASDILKLGDLTVDTRRRTVSDGTNTATFTVAEFSILHYLLLHRDESFSSAQLLSGVWPSDQEASEEVVRVHVRVMRKKLELAKLPPIIAHRRGFGYSVELPGKS